jgi:hypothetical protein
MRRAVLHQCIKVRVKIHSFRLTLLLINVRHPDQWCAPLRECFTNLWYEKVRDQARVEASRPENEQISFSNRIECARGSLDPSYV